MANLTRTLILTGGRAGQTVQLGKFFFNKGKVLITGSDREVESLTKYVSRCWAAYPEGSIQLKQAQQQDKERIHGLSDSQTEKQPTQRPHDPLPSDVQSQGQGPAPISPDDGSGTSASTSGAQGSVPGGDGHTDTGDDGTPSDADRIRKAVESLDPKNNEHWTNDGRPRVDAVAELIGNPALGRADINTAAPDFKRPS